MQHRLARNVGDIGGVAQPHVEALRADRRQHMRGFADQCDALPGELPGLLDGQRKQVTAGLDTDTAENGVRLPLGGIREFVIAQRHQPPGFTRGHDPHHAGAVPRQRHEYAGSLRGMKFGGDISMRPRMRDVEGQRGLIEIAALDVDAGGLAAQRMPAIGADHQPRGQ